MTDILHQLLIINISAAKSTIADVYSISELKKETIKVPGVFLFFNGTNKLIKFGCSYDDVVLHAINNSHDADIYGYNLVYDLDNPLTDKTIDRIYDNISNDKLHMNLLHIGIELDINIILN